MRYRWTTLALLAASVLVSAPRTQAAPQSSDQPVITQQQAQDLRLSDDQKNQVKGVNQSRREQIQATQRDSSLTREQKRERIRGINQGSNQQIHGLLTPEQRQRRRAHDRREDVRDRREDRRDRREDVRDRREDRRDAAHQGGPRDRREDVRDRREDVRDRREDVRDRREDRRDRRIPPRPHHPR